MDVSSIALSYLGAKQGDSKHKKLVDTFNKVKPNGEVANYSCAWCAIASTSFLILAGYTKEQVPMSYNCGTLITIAKKYNVWVEDDNYLPKVNDRIIYNWDDSGKGDCKTGAYHVGTVIEVYGNTIKVIEGNYSTKKNVAIRTITRNQRYIRGYIKFAPITVKEVVKKKYTGTYPKLPNRGYFKKGDKGTNVKRLQKLLNWSLKGVKGFVKLEVDGILGNNTIKMVVLFQKIYNLVQDEQFGKKCLAKAKEIKK